MKKFKTTAVFLGPSVDKAEARSLLDADYYPPACKGDIYRILTSGVQTIVLIDGVFHSTPTVWQREILYALSQGVRVVGASSMGALRAAELHTLGMIGRGTVFQWYRDGVVNGDDEVALLHGPAEADFRALSEPLVNIRCTLQSATADQYLRPGEAKALLTCAKQLFYPDRSYRRLLQSPVLQRWSRKRVARLEHYFSTRKIDIKRLDAIDALRFAARIAKRGTAKMPAVRSEEETWTQNARLLATGFIGRKLVTGAAVLKEARKRRRLVRPMQATLSKRRFLLEWARQNGIAVPRKFRNDFAAQWAKEHGIERQSTWLRANGLTRATYAELLTARTLLEWITQKGPAHFGLEQSFISNWARQHGVSSTRKNLEDWIIKHGPRYFGLDWRFDVAFLQELQLTGKAAGIVAALNTQ